MLPSAIQDAVRESFFATLPDQLVQALFEDAIRLRLPAGGTIYREGDEPRAGLVVRGLVRVFVESTGGRQVTVRYARPGDVLGVAAAVGGPPPVSVQALSECELWMVSVPRLLRMGDQDASVAMALARELTERLYDTLDELAGFAFAPVRQRVARHLLDLAANAAASEHGLVAPVTHQELAEATGSTREVVTRAIGDLRAAGLIASSEAGIALLDPAALHAAAVERR